MMYTRLLSLLLLLLATATSAWATTDLTRWVDESAVNPRADRARTNMDEVDEALETGNTGNLEDDLEDVAKYARHPHNRARALIALGDVRTAQMDYYDAFKAFQEAVNLYANIIPLEEVITKEYNLATDHLRIGPRKHVWMPFFKGNLQAVEVYDHIVKATPQHYLAPLSLFRAGIILRWEKDYPGSIQRLRRLIHDYPNVRSAAHAQVEIAQSMLVAASEFDGDGALTREAKTYLDRFFVLYPEYKRRETAEGDEATVKLLEEKRELAVKLLAQANEIEAKRYLYLATFYQNPEHDSDKATRRFLKLIVDDYAETSVAGEAQVLLANLPPPPPPETTPEPPAEGAGEPDAKPTEKLPDLKRGAVTGPAAAAKEATTEQAEAEAAQPPRRKSEKWLLPIRDVDTDEPLEEEEP